VGPASAIHALARLAQFYRSKIGLAFRHWHLGKSFGTNNVCSARETRLLVVATEEAFVTAPRTHRDIELVRAVDEGAVGRRVAADSYAALCV